MRQDARLDPEAAMTPFEYLNALQHHAREVIDHAARWLPWNYREQLGGAP